MTKRDKMSKEILAKLEKMTEKIYDIDKKVDVMDNKITNMNEVRETFEKETKEKIKCNETEIKGLKEFTAKAGTYITILIIVVTTVVTAVVGKVLELIGLK